MSDFVMILLDFYCGVDVMGEGNPDHSMRWFPGQEYRVISNRNYLVDPAISNLILDPKVRADETILARACYLADPWQVTEESWAAFQWSERVVYVPHFRGAEKNNVYKRRVVTFDPMPKPSLDDVRKWEEDFHLAFLPPLAEIPPFLDWSLSDSREALLSQGHSEDHVGTASAILHARTFALIALALDETGGLRPDATTEEIRAARVSALNAAYEILLPAALDAAMLVEVAKLAPDQE